MYIYIHIITHITHVSMGKGGWRGFSLSGQSASFMELPHDASLSILRHTEEEEAALQTHTATHMSYLHVQIVAELLKYQMVNLHFI